MENNPEGSLLQMHLDGDGGRILQETVRWSRFLSIVGIVVLSICLLVFMLLGTALLAALSKLEPGIATLAGLGGAVIFVLLLAGFAVAGFLVYMLLRFSTLTRKGIDQQDQAVFAEGMKCLKRYFIVSGIIALLELVGSLITLTRLFHS